MQTYKYPTNETATDSIESIQDSGKRIREIASITAMATYEWKTCLDFGTGIGRNLNVLYHANKTVPDRNIIAYDIDEARLLSAKNNMRSQKNIKFLSGDIQQLDAAIAENSIDCILCCQVIGHTTTSETRKILDFFYKKLAIRGKLIICVPFCASKKENDFFHVIDSMKADNNKRQYRKKISEKEFNAIGASPTINMLPVRAFGVHDLSAWADNSDLPLHCQPPQSIIDATLLKSVSSFIYSIHYRYEDGSIIGDMILKMRR